MAYGGPDTLSDVEPYLLDVRGGRPTSPELVEEIRERYALIGGSSPLLAITRRQAQALQNALNQSQPGAFRVYVGMRHWTPYIRDVVGEIAASGVRRLVTLCMTPFGSRMTTGAYAAQLRQGIEMLGRDHPWQTRLDLREIGPWYTNPLFIRALADNLLDALEAFPGEPQVVFTAHSLPAALTEQGDPYDAQFQDLARLVAEEARLPRRRWRTSYQSAGASSVRWLGPTLEETIEELARDEVPGVLVAPIGFLADHVEVLYDIDIESQHEARAAGITLARTASLNDQPLFIDALAQLVYQALEETEKSE